MPKNKQDKNKQDKYIKIPSRCWSLAAFLLPVLACVVILCLKKVYPFGDMCILRSDMYDQYCPFFYEFARMLKSGDLSQYDWNMGLGAGYISTYSYYLSSPLNFLLFFVPERYIIEFMTYSIVFRLGVSGFSFYRFLKYRFGLEKTAKNEFCLVAILLSTAYAMSGYVCAYNWQIMWMDCIALAPLVFLGLLKLCRENKPALYFVTLAISIFSNYYIAMMICIVLVFYWGYLLFEETKKGERLRFTINFGLYSLLAGGASALIILPTAIDLKNSGSDIVSFPTQLEWYFSPFTALAKGNAFVSLYIGNSFWPHIYAGVFTLILLIVFILTKEIPWKKKLPKLLMLLFFQISFMNNILSYLWHGFRFPTFFPSRQSFLYIFLLLVIAMEGYLHIESVNKRFLLAGLGIMLLMVVLSAFFVDEELSDGFSFRMTASLIVIYAVLYFLRGLVGQENRAFIGMLLLAACFAELFGNMNFTGFNPASRTEFVTNFERTNQLLKLREEGDYRTDFLAGKYRNDASLFGASTISVFNTVMNMKVSNYYSRHMMDGAYKDYRSKGITPIVAAMLGVRYQITEGEEAPSELRSLVGKAGDYCLYENNYYLPIGFTLPGTTLTEENDDADYFDTLNGMARDLVGEELFVPVDAAKQETVGGTTELTIDRDGFYYMQNLSTNATWFTISYPNGVERDFEGIDSSLLVELGQAKAGDRFTITNDDEKMVSAQLLSFDLEVAARVFDSLNKNTFRVTNKTSNSLEGTIEVEEGERVFFSIPADKGWKAYVDGKEVEIESYCDAFLCLRPEAGQRTITLVYEAPFFKKGIAISICCSILGIIMLLLSGIGRKRTAFA